MQERDFPSSLTGPLDFAALLRADSSFLNEGIFCLAPVGG
jgi:hypothetical protein